MASQTLHRLLLLSLLAISATARPGRPFHPCHQTLILFSTSTSTSSSSFPLHLDNSSPQNPNNFRRTQSITLFITQLRPLDFYPSNSIPSIPNRDRDDSSLYSSSFRDRTRDILSVVGSLLFGVGCGALTAATMYLVWSLFAASRLDSRDYSDDELESDYSEDDFSPKKMGYAAIPAAAAADSASPLVVAKEVV